MNAVVAPSYRHPRESGNDDKEGQLVEISRSISGEALRDAGMAY